MTRRFLIVTPCLNAAAFIDETVMSIVGQAGNFEIFYHVQDGGSRDGTVERLQNWERRFRQGGVPILCRAVTFSIDSRPDQGMYHAITRGFAALRGDERTFMTWLNASDRLMPGALQTAADVADLFPDVEWLCGRIARLNARGHLVHVEDCFAFPAKTLAAGLHDNRHLPFVQQEGCLWSARLWQAAGGINPALRLAGDFDLWRRFAEHRPLSVVNSLLGTFRHHDAQLGSDGPRYLAEVDVCLSDIVERRDAVWAEYRAHASPKNHGELTRREFTGPVLQFVESERAWRRLERFPFAQR